jgi:hypothetical protein
MSRTKVALALLALVIAAELAVSTIPVAIGLSMEETAILLAVLAAPLAEELGRLVATHKSVLWTYTLILVAYETLAYSLLITEMYGSLPIALALRVPAACMHIFCAYRLEKEPNEKGFHKALTVHILFNAAMFAMA